MNEQIGDGFVFVDKEGITKMIPWMASNDSLEEGTDRTVEEAVNEGWILPTWGQTARREETYWKWDKKIRKRIRGVYQRWKEFKEQQKLRWGE